MTFDVLEPTFLAQELVKDTKIVRDGLLALFLRARVHPRLVQSPRVGGNSDRRWGRDSKIVGVGSPIKDLNVALEPGSVRGVRLAWNAVVGTECLGGGE